MDKCCCSIQISCSLRKDENISFKNGPNAINDLNDYIVKPLFLSKCAYLEHRRGGFQQLRVVCDHALSLSSCHTAVTELADPLRCFKRKSNRQFKSVLTCEEFQCFCLGVLISKFPCCQSSFMFFCVSVSVEVFNYQLTEYSTIYLSVNSDTTQYEISNHNRDKVATALSSFVNVFRSFMVVPIIRWICQVCQTDEHCLALNAPFFVSTHFPPAHHDALTSSQLTFPQADIRLRREDLESYLFRRRLPYCGSRR